MKITVLGGSPKGSGSVTMQYVEYMRRRRPDVEWTVHQPALRISRLERNEDQFDEIIDSVHGADAVLWAFPLYVHGVCSQYQRFIELIFERDSGSAFAGKPSAALCTSINFFDNIAVDYIRSVSESLNMPWAGFHSANMRDLTTRSGAEALDGFLRSFLSVVETGWPVSRVFPPAGEGELMPLETAGTYTPELTTGSGNAAGRNVVIVTDSEEGNLGGMVRKVNHELGGEARIINLEKLEMAGGCLGCLKCGPANRCSWDGRDDVRSAYENDVEKADILILASRVRVRWHSALMKRFIDRGFFHTHQPFLKGIKTMVLLEGSLAANPILKNHFQAYMEWQGADLIGFASDRDCGTVSGKIDADGIDHVIESLACSAVLAADASISIPRTFVGIGGMSIFRDEIFSHLRMVFRADHRYFRRNGIYRTMIQRRPLTLIGYRLIGVVTSLPPIQNRMVANIRKFMVAPYRRILETAKPMDGAAGPAAEGADGPMSSAVA